MKTLKYIVAVLLLVSVSSCRTLEEYNISPNQIEVGKITPADMMDELLCNGVLNCQQRFYDTFAELMQYTCITSSSNEVVSRYYIAPSYTENCWNNFSRWFVNADHMYALAVERDLPNYQAVAITLRTMYAEMLTSVYGYVPFFEANKLREGINKPSFDSELSIYTQLILDLEKANEIYSSQSGNVNLNTPAKDKLYGGDIRKWRKFNNSLMLRILMRLSNRSNDMILYWGQSVAQKIKNILDNPSEFPLMENIMDSATVYFTGESPFQNTWGGYAQTGLSGHRGSEYFIDELNKKVDPRKWLFFVPWSQSISWTGVKSGYPSDETLTTGYPQMNFEIFVNYKMPVSFMRYDEICFLKAEAQARRDDDHWAAITGNPEIAFNEGIRASCEFWRYVYVDYMGLEGRFSKTNTYRNFAAVNVNPAYPELLPVIDDAAITTYIQSQEFDVVEPIKCIINQKYMSSFRICLEAYNDYRRTGYPELSIGTGTYNDGILPRRLEYPSKTKTTNPDKYQEVLDKLAATYYDGGDNMKTPIWWSQDALGLEIR